MRRHTAERPSSYLNSSPTSARIALVLLLLCSLGLLSACASHRTEPRSTNVCPTLEPLSGQTLRAMQPNSTDLLNRADSWLESSDQLLQSVTDNSSSSDNSSSPIEN